MLKFFGRDKKPELEAKEAPQVEMTSEERARVNASTWSPIMYVNFDGEKTPGEIGVIKRYMTDYIRLRDRSWQLYMESDVAQGVLRKFAKWVVGGGLKLQSEPIMEVLRAEGVNFNPEDFSKSVEARFKLFAKSKRTGYSSEQSLNDLAQEAIIAAYVGGDVLVINRYDKDNKRITSQNVDGALVMSPAMDSSYWRTAKTNGNKIVDGVEINARGEHVAYYIQKDMANYERIEAKDSRGRKMAFLVYGLKYRIGDVRGIPLLTAVMQSIKMLDRYKEATVGSAEERQKITFAIEHDKESTGVNPLMDKLASSYTTKSDVSLDYAKELEQTQGLIKTTTQKQTINMPNGAKLKQLESNNELTFEPFFNVNIDVACACIGIPPEVARSKYDSNFSASRAAIKDWEHTLLVERGGFGQSYYQPTYELFLDINILRNKIIAPGYKSALFSEDIEVLEAYRNARWTGASVPHIDPVKEVNAERLKLGLLGAHLPLTSHESAAAVFGEESSALVTQFEKEVEKIKPPVNESGNGGQ